MVKKGLAFCEQLLFPRRCPVCDGIVTPFGEKICLECLGKLQILTPPYCMKCGKKLKDDGEVRELCADCRRGTHRFDRGRALYEYGSVARSVYRLKYGGRREYAEFFGEEMAEYLGGFLRRGSGHASALTGKDCRTVLVPVPLHRKRRIKRGYNQAEELAVALGRKSGLPVHTGLVKRVKNTIPLKQLDPIGRQNNLKKAFIINENDVKLYERVFLVDDIYTTGSTMDEISGMLREAGVSEIYFVTLACGAGV